MLELPREVTFKPTTICSDLHTIQRLSYIAWTDHVDASTPFCERWPLHVTWRPIRFDSMGTGSQGFRISSLQTTLAQCCFDVGPPSQTAAQHQNNIDPISPVHWYTIPVSRYWSLFTQLPRHAVQWLVRCRANVSDSEATVIQRWRWDQMLSMPAG